MLTAGWLAAAGNVAWAGRPLGVDDANVNGPGKGHVEVWAERAARATVFNLAPAYAPVDGVELGAQLSRVRGGSDTASAVQVKWRITPSQENGCNHGAVLGIAHASNGGGNAPYLNGLMSCNEGVNGSLHLNLGTVRPRNASATTTWGAAIEKAFGPVTSHLEWFGGQGTKPTLQVGLRGDVFTDVQLDSAIGRSGGGTLFSIGVKFGF